MLNIKKTAAFVMSLLLCVPSYAAVTAAADVDLKHESSEDILVDDDINAVDTETVSSELKTADGFSYSVTVDNTACIEMCTSKEKDLVIPDTIDGLKVTNLGKTAFGSDDTAPYETITLPDTLEYISASNPFIHCKSLKEIITGENNTAYKTADGVLYSKDMTEIVCYPCAISGDSYTIDKKTTKIGASAFYCSKLKNITFPSALETVEHHGISNCENLVSADLSGTAVKTLNDFCFIGCTKLSDVKLSATIQNINGGVFANCSSLETIDLPMGLLAIGQSAFANTGLTYAVIPDSVQEIDYSAFGYTITDDGTETADPDFILVGSNTGSAAYVYAKDSDSDYEYQNDFIFMTNDEFTKRQEILNLEKFTEGDFEYTVQDGSAAVTNCLSNEETVTVPEKLGGYPVTSTYMSAFSSCFARKIILPETITIIREGSFFGCSFLTELTLPQSVKDIEDNAFSGCQVLEKIDLGGAENLGRQLFDDCPKLTSITLSGKCKTFSEDEPFIVCNALREINVAGEGDGNFTSKEGVLYSRDMKSLIAYPASKSDKEFKIPSEVEIIEQSAFAYANFLETVDLSSVKVINDYAFEGCDSLTKVKMSKELTTLGADAFYDCHNLKSLRFYDKIENIAEYSFGFCYNESADTEEGAGTEENDKVTEGFKVYAEKGSIPYLYAEEFGLTPVSGTIELFDHNVSVVFLIVCGAIILLLILALIISAAVKNRKKKKAEKAKADAIKKRKAEKDAAEKKDEEKE